MGVFEDLPRGFVGFGLLSRDYVINRNANLLDIVDDQVIIRIGEDGELVATAQLA